MNHPHSFRCSLLLTGALFLPACAIEMIDDLIAERGVTECSSSTGSSDSTQTSSSDTGSTGTGTGSSGSTDATSDASTGTDGLTTTSSTGETDTTAGDLSVCGNGIVEPGEDCDDTTTFCNAACIKSLFVFVTSDPSLQAGAIDGLIGADYQCRHRAAVMNFPNAERYRAWISTSTVDARDRVEHHAGRYILVNGLIVAENWDEFASDSHQNPINVTEQSQTLVANIWTGTQSDGTRVPGQSHCQDWTSSSALEKAYAGDSAASDASWTNNQVLNPRGCINTMALYCIEQP